MSLRKCKGTAMIIEWLKKNNINHINIDCNMCKFYKDKMCSKQDMRCYYTNKKQCDLFELQLNKSQAFLIIQIPERGFVKKYINKIEDNLEKLITDENFKQSFVKDIFMQEKCFSNSEVINDWVDIIIDFVESSEATTQKQRQNKLSGENL